MKQFKWRGTWGVGDVCMALNVVHNYSYTHDVLVELEMHWNHDEDYKEHKCDPETIVERMSWLHKQYYQNDRVKVSHVFNTSLFKYDIPYTQDYQSKTRWIFPDNKPNVDIEPYRDWVYNELPEPTFNKDFAVIWTPRHNSEPPKVWKRQLTKEDWSHVITELDKLSDITELTYRTPVAEAFRLIKDADYIISYEGMWHGIARNFAKAIAIQSPESVTLKNTPQVKLLSSRPKFLEWFNSDLPRRITGMQNRAEHYYKKLVKYYED